MASFGRHLRAENLSVKTLEAYTESTRRFARFLAVQGMPQEVANIRREHVEAFIADLLDRWKAATANNRFQSLQTFFTWLAEDGEVKECKIITTPPNSPGASQNNDADCEDNDSNASNNNDSDEDEEIETEMYEWDGSTYWKTAEDVIYNDDGTKVGNVVSGNPVFDE